MSDRAERVLGALMEYDASEGCGYPIVLIHNFFGNMLNTRIGKCYEDYESLTADEEREVIQAFLEFAY